MTAKVWDLRHGAWQDVLADVEAVDTTIVDAPYSDRVHAGSDAVTVRDDLGYTSMRAADVEAHVGQWSRRTSGWFCTITCHVLAPAWSAALEAAGRYVFAPVPIVDLGMTVRMQGDGPASWACYLVVARPRGKEWLGSGALPGAYVRGPGDPRSQRRGGKPEGIMRAIVRDYSRPGDLVLDTHAGGGTTGVAAILEGRRFVGSEVDREAFDDAQARARPHIARAGEMVGIETGQTLGLFG